MALVSYPVHADRIGDVLVTGEPYPQMDGHSQRRDASTGHLLWTVRASLLDVDLEDFAGEISLRLPSVDKPDVRPDQFVALTGSTRVTSYQVGRGGDARASVSLRGDGFQIVGVSDTDSAGDHTRGLFVDWTGLPDLRFTRASRSTYRAGRPDGPCHNYEACRPYSSDSGSGVERHIVEVRGDLVPVKRKASVVFEGLRAIPVLNRETRRANLQLAADSIRIVESAPAQPFSTGRTRRTESTPEPAPAEG